jgi:hypothetical protein
MRRSSKPLPKGPNQLAYEIVKISTEEASGAVPAPSALSIYFAQIGKVGGLKGGKARAEVLSKARRRAIAKKAAAARWKNSKSQGKKS